MPGVRLRPLLPRLFTRLAFPRLASTAAGALAALLAAVSPHPAAAQVGSERYASIVVDAGTGNVVSAANPDEFRYPASLTKMMTLYMLFEALRDRRLSLDQPVPVSSWAASMSPTKLGLVPGSYITVEQCILGLVTKSANDAAAALGELMGGDEERFAQMMTLRARALGMAHTTFRNASGLPDWGQVTTARDLAVLARHLVQDFPTYYRYFSVPSFVFHGRTILNHQHMLQTYPGADGLKTGYINDSGYNLATSAVHGDTRLIGVVLGAANGGERDQHMAMLLDQGFDRLGVAPMMARREPPAYPAMRMPSIIGSAQAAPFLAPPYQGQPYVAAPYPVAPSQALRGPALQMADARGRSRPSRPRAAEPFRAAEPVTRRVPEWRPDRFRLRPIIATAPAALPSLPRSAAIPSREAASGRATRFGGGNPGGTRTATWPAYGRFPG